MRERKPCSNCGGEKPRGRRCYCDACAQEALERRTEAKPCKGCGGEKPRRSGVLFCEACQIARQAEAEAARKAVVEARRAKRLAEAEEREAKQLAFGRVPKRWAPKTRFPPYLPAAPLATRLETRALLCGVGGGPFGSRVTGATVDDFYKRIGVSEKAARQWRLTEGATVQFSTADRILMELGWDWTEVWDRESCPELIAALEATDADPEPDAWCRKCGEVVPPVNGMCPWHVRPVQVWREHVVEAVVA